MTMLARLFCAALIFLQQPLASAQYRQMLTGDTPLYIASYGLSSNNCLSSGAPCKTCQQASDLAASWDLNNKKVTINFIDEGTPVTWTANCTINTMVGGGIINFIGSATRGNTIINVTGDDGFRLNNVGPTNISFSQMTIMGGGINVTYMSRMQVGVGLVCATVSNTCMGIHDSQAVILILGSGPSSKLEYTISGNQGVANIEVNGGMLFMEYANVALENTPSWPVGFIYANHGGRVQATNVSYSGTGATGPRFNGEILSGLDSGGGGSTAWPGSTPGVAGWGSVYVP
jgi:hypothetical protein